MADILEFEDAKLKFRIAHRIIAGTKSFPKAHKSLQNCTNPIYRKAYKKIMEAANYTERYHQKAIVADFGPWFLNIPYKDTAYHHMAIWILNELINDKKFCEEVRKQVVPPDKWYVNSWKRTLDSTEEMQKKGQLTKFELAEDEKIYVPPQQLIKWNKLGEEEARRMNLKIEEEMRKRKKI